MKSILPTASYVKQVLAAIEEHPLGAVLLALFVIGMTYVWRH